MRIQVRTYRPTVSAAPSAAAVRSLFTAHCSPAVDPKSDEYPSFSPYTYCANNPVKLVDPEGEDYEVVIEGNTITIKATYYITKDAKKEMKEAIKMWNNTIFAYKLNDGK